MSSGASGARSPMGPQLRRGSDAGDIDLAAISVVPALAATALIGVAVVLATMAWWPQHSAPQPSFGIMAATIVFGLVLFAIGCAALMLPERFGPPLVVVFMVAVSAFLVAVLLSSTQADWVMAYMVMLIVTCGAVQQRFLWWLASVVPVVIAWTLAGVATPWQNETWRNALLLTALALTLSWFIHHTRRTHWRMLSAERESARSSAATDPMTGLLNRRGMLEVTQVRRRTQDWGDDVRVSLIDVDGLKGINDRHGHAAGDAAIVAVARALRTATRAEEDLLVRWGGDEFVIISDGKSPDASEFQRRVNLALARDCPADAEWTAQVSVGTATHTDTVAQTLEELVSEADANMYASKRRR